MKFIILDENIHPDAVALLKENEHEETQDKAEADILFIRTAQQATCGFLEEYPQAKYILRAGVGLDNVDKLECEKRNIQIFNSPGANANAVAEMIMTLVLASARNITAAHKKMQEGVWDRFSFIGQELQSKQFGLIGFGAVGKALHKKVRGFDMDIIVFDPYLSKEQCEAYDGVTKVEDLNELLQQADIVSIQVPLTPETKDMINKETFETMKDTSILINISRGGIVKEDDLIDALKNKKIGAAALDVFVKEPDFDKKLTGIPNLILTPHISSLTHKADRAMSVVAVERFLESVK